MLKMPDLVRAVVALSLALGGVACNDPQVAKRRHLERGDQYVGDNKLEFAAIEYANAVQLDPQFGAARYKLAQTYERMNRLPEAYAEYIRAADALPDDRDVQLKATEVLLLAGRFDDARQRATALLDRNPKDIDALLLRANAMASLKDPSGAMAELEQAMAVRPDDSRPLVSIGTVRLQSGEIREAEAAFRQAVELDPSSVDAHLALGHFLWTTERVDEAEKTITRALAIDPENILANRMLGMLYLATGRVEQAEQPLKAIATASDLPEARLQLADYYLTIGRTDQARQLFAELAAQPTTANEADLRLASLDYAAKRVGEAHQRVDRVLERASNYAPALALKAQWLAQENKLDEALSRANAAVSVAPDSAAARFALATVHDRRGEVTDAIKQYSEVLRVNPRAAAAQVELSRLNLATGNREAALRHAEEAMHAEPTSIAARVALVRTLLVRGELSRADTEIQTLAGEAPDSALVHTLQGTLHARRRNAAAARTSFERARALAPQLTEPLAGLVALDIEARQPASAVTRVEAELAKDGNRPELLAIAAQAYNAAGQSDRAEQLLKRAVAVDPRFSSGYLMLAGMYVRQQRLDEARSEFERMAERDPRAAAPRTMVGVILEAQGKREEAKRWYEATLTAVGDAPVVANNLAMIYADEGSNLDQALQLATTAKQRLPDNADVDDTLGWVYYKKNLPMLAVRPFEDSLRKRPDRPEVLLHLGLTYAKLGNTAKARESLERALTLSPTFAGHQLARQTLASLNGNAQ